MYARFRSRSIFYSRRAPVVNAYGVQSNVLRKLKIKGELKHGVYRDEQVDLRDKKRLELVEAMRHPLEKDFYQDHTYHSQWISREPEDHQKRMLVDRYGFMTPNYEINPWIWYPGDIVEVVSGESRGIRGTIIAVVKYRNEILVQNVNVQDVTIPATETRPESTVQREHPIKVHRVRHVDPSTNEPCEIRLVTVRNKETGELEEKRISLSSGVLIPIPPRDENLDVGDPLRDTPIQDADEPTYNPDEEIPVLVERKLRAMEDHFISQLKLSYEFHSRLAARNEKDMRRFQVQVLKRATEIVTNELVKQDKATWWSEEMSPFLEQLEARAEERAAAAAAAASEASEGAPSLTTVVEEEDEEDIEEDEEEQDPQSAEQQEAPEGGRR